MLTGYGKEGGHNCSHGGTIFNDAATSVIWVENQVFLGAGETVMAKTCFEEWLMDLAHAGIKHIQSDIMYLLLMSFMQIALRNINRRVFQELLLIIKMPMWNMPFRQLCTWHNSSSVSDDHSSVDSCDYDAVGQNVVGPDPYPTTPIIASEGD